jgi:superfamily II DNA/RNA helicase
MSKYLSGDFVAYNGNMPNSVRKSIEERFCSGEIKRLLATDAFSEGVDTTHVSVVMEWGWSSTDQTVSQRAGRGRRKSPGKNLSLVITPSDDWEILTSIEGVTKDNPLHSKRRKRVLNYKKRGWPVRKVRTVKEIDFSQIRTSGDFSDKTSGESQT